MAAEEQARQAGRAVRLLEATFPEESHDPRTWDDCKALQPHADHVTELAERCRTALDSIGELLDRVGVFDEYRARLEDARARLSRAAAVKEEAFGPADPRLARSLGNLGIVAAQQGDLAGARALLERALRIFEAAYGPEHPDVTGTLTNLGSTLAEAGEPGEAEPLVQRALSIFRQAVGEEHPDTIEARELLERIEETLRTGMKGEESPRRGVATDPNRKGPPQPG
jgi:Tfp pilus assembly protein PilF